MLFRCAEEAADAIAAVAHNIGGWPSFHMVGQKDTLIPVAVSEALAASRFHEPVVFASTAGHYVQTNKKACRALGQFLSQFLTLET